MYQPSAGESVIVFTIDKYGLEHYTTGRATGETGQFGEHFEVLTESPLVEEDKGRFHYEDLHELTDENIERLIG